MNSRTKFPLSIGLLSLLCLTLPVSLRADTTWTYTGQAYTTCTGTYASSGTTCGGPYALSVTFDVKAGTQLDNLFIFHPETDISSSISTFSFTDGTGLVVTQATPTSHRFAFQVGNGIIELWEVEVSGFGTGSFFITSNDAILTEDASQTASGGVIIGSGNDLPLHLPGTGTWTQQVTTTPEPSSYLLFGTGLLCLLALAARRKGHAPLTL
jgi:hypothetical protein